MAVIDCIVTVRIEKRWRKRLQEASEQITRLFSRKTRLEFDLEIKEMKIQKLEKDLEEYKEKLKKAHEKVAMLMVEYNRLNKK